MLYEIIIKKLKNFHGSIYTEELNKKFTIPSKSTLIEYPEFFTASDILSHKNTKLSANGEKFILIEGYVTFRRYVKMQKVITKRKGLLRFFSSDKISYNSDENEIVDYLKNRNVKFTKDFDDEKLASYFYYWLPVYFIVDEKGNQSEEISRKQLKAIEHKIKVYRNYKRRQFIKKKEESIRNKANKFKN